jgi:hypothetical protein
MEQPTTPPDDVQQPCLASRSSDHHQYPISTWRIQLPAFQHAHTPLMLMESQGFGRHMMCLKFRNPACHTVLHCPLSSRRRCSCRLGVLSLERFAPLIRAANRSYPTAKADDQSRWTVRWRVNVRFSAVSPSLVVVYGGVQDGGVNVPVGRKIAQPGSEDNTYLDDSR